MEAVVVFSVHFLGSPSYIRNPYLRSKLMEILFELTPERESEKGLATNNRFEYIFKNNEVTVRHLVPSLINLYVDIETTGSKTPEIPPTNN
jgi:ubiquitin conjugation factor E4 B